MEEKITFEEWTEFLHTYLNDPLKFNAYSYFLNKFGIDDLTLKRLQHDSVLEYVADKYVNFTNLPYRN